jgi:hypothetical protein
MKTKSYGSPIVVQISKRRWRLLEDWATPFGTIPHEYMQGGELKQFITNGASIPWYFRWAVKNDGVLFDASVFHDYYLKTATETKAYADYAFDKINKDGGVNRLFRKAALIAVKCFGKGIYK